MKKYMNDRQWEIYEMLKGNHKLDFQLIYNAKKRDLINAIIWYISRNVDYDLRTEDQRKSI